MSQAAAAPRPQRKNKSEGPSNVIVKKTKRDDQVATEAAARRSPVRDSSSSNSGSESRLAPPRIRQCQDHDEGNSGVNLSPLPEDEGDVDEEEELLSGNRPEATTRTMVIHYGKEVLCLLAILLTTLASSYSGTPKVGRPPSPRQFFPPGCMVNDYPTGNLDAVSQQVSLSELSFVFYYAPWDAASQAARQPYADVAQFYYKEAYFAAINCWQPGGECKQQYSKIKAWPVLMAYLPKNGLGVLYNGPWERDPMMRFVNSFLRPLKRLNDPDDLLQEMTAHDAIVVAFLDLSRDYKAWNIFYETAVKWLYRDPFQDVRFSIVTGESRSKFGVDGDEPVLRMYLWNETLEYDNANWTNTQAIENWATKHVHRVALWMTPSGFKSISLANYFKDGPVLVFFTPRNLLKQSTDAMEMMRQIGMEYNNCNGDEWIREMVREYLPGQRQEHRDQLKALKTYCQGYMATMTSQRRPVSITFANLMNGSSQMNARDRVEDICQLEPDSMFLRRGRGVPDEDGHCNKESCTGGTRGERGGGGAPSERLKWRETSMLRNDLDRRAPLNLEKLAMRRQCELLFIDSENSVHSFIGPKPFEGAMLQGIEGLGCQGGNRSLTLLLMDSTLFHVFSERLGVDILTTERKSGVIIVDPKDESTYVLNPNEELTLSSISRFIHKFSAGKLRRHLRSTHLDYSHTHFYNKLQGDGRRRRTIEIEELTSRNFASVMLSTARRLGTKSLLVFFYSSNCAFCTMMSHHLLQIENLLKGLTEARHLRIVRIDGDKNDLPWPFTVAEYPSLIFFPGGGGGESRQFTISSRNSVSLDKILGFVIANLARPLRIYAIQQTCAASRRSVRSLDNCLASLRHEVHESIAISLREWRRSGGGELSQSRAAIIRRLQLLEALYLDTFKINETTNQCQSCDFNKLEGYCKRIVSIWGAQSAVKS